MSSEPPPRSLPPSASRSPAPDSATRDSGARNVPAGTFALIEAGPSGSWRIALAGVAGACVLGAGLGFLARPAPEAAFGAKPEATGPVETPVEPLLQVVVDETPAPIGPPIEVLPPDMAAAAAESAAPYTMPALPAPDRPASGDVARLVKAIAVASPAIRKTEPAPKAESRPRPAPDRAGSVAARSESKPKAQRQAKAEARKKTTAPKPAAATKSGDMRPKRPVAAAAKPRPADPSSARKPPVRKPAAAPLHGDGPTRVARADGCGTGCDDALLAARERQLQRAYAEAEAAGVPSQALRRQQARWREARAAAAREAPWAVEDVYLARISELRDLTRDARDE